MDARYFIARAAAPAFLPYILKIIGDNLGCSSAFRAGLSFTLGSLTRAENFVGFKHKKSSVFVGFTSPKPIKALTFFVGFKHMKRRFSK